MNAEIPSDLTPFVEGLISQGRYADPDAVVAESIRLLESQEALRRDVREGFAQLDAGQGIDARAVYERVEQRIRQVERGQSAG